MIKKSALYYLCIFNKTLYLFDFKIKPQYHIFSFCSSLNELSGLYFWTLYWRKRGKFFHLHSFSFFAFFISPCLLSHRKHWNMTVSGKLIYNSETFEACIVDWSLMKPGLCCSNNPNKRWNGPLGQKSSHSLEQPNKYFLFYSIFSQP